MKALLVHAEVDECLGVLAPDSGGGERGVEFRMARVDLTFGTVMAEREHAVFEPAHAVETPLSVDDGLGVLALGEGFGRESGEEFGGEALVGGEIFGG